MKRGLQVTENRRAWSTMVRLVLAVPVAPRRTPVPPLGVRRLSLFDVTRRRHRGLPNGWAGSSTDSGSRCWAMTWPRFEALLGSGFSAWPGPVCTCIRACR